MTIVMRLLAWCCACVPVLFASGEVAHAAAPQPDGLLDTGGPLPLAYQQSLYAGYFEDRVGTVVSLSGEVLAVGVPGADVRDMYDVGRVDIYRWFADGHQWMHTQTYGPSAFGLDAVANMRLGAAVSLSGDWLLIGCPGCPPETAVNAVLVHLPESVDRPGAPNGTITWYDVTPPDLLGFSDPYEGTGAAVALSVVRTGIVSSPGESVVFAIGSPKATQFVVDGVTESEGGAIAIGRLDVGQQQVVWEAGPIYGAPAFGKFGHALALSAATWINLGIHVNERDLVIGSPGWSPPGEAGIRGRAVVLRRSGSTWSIVQTLLAPTPGFLDAAGSAVAVERVDPERPGTIALGAPGRAVAGTQGGSVLLFRQSGIGGDYVFEQEVQPASTASADRFGGALALSNGTLLAGADGHAVGGWPNAGTAHLYRYGFDLLSGTFRWRFRQTFEEPGGVDNGAFGSSIALGPRAAAIGAPLSDAAGLGNAGSVVTYLCDQIFRYGHDTAAMECPGP